MFLGAGVVFGFLESGLCLEFVVGVRIVYVVGVGVGGLRLGLGCFLLSALCLGLGGGVGIWGSGCVVLGLGMRL